MILKYKIFNFEKLRNREFSFIKSHENDDKIKNLLFNKNFKYK